MKSLILFACLLAGCSAGNLTIAGETKRVSSCSMTDAGIVYYVERGQPKIVAPKHAYFEQTIFSPVGSDLCAEVNILCD